MKRNYYLIKICFLLLFLFGNNAAQAVKNFKVSFDKVRVIPAKTSSDINPTIYIKKGANYLTAGKKTKIKIDASDYLKRKRIKFPTQIKVQISKPDPVTNSDIWLRTSTRTLTSLAQAKQIILNLDLSSYLSDYTEELSFKLYTAKGNLIQEYSQVFIAEDYSPRFARKGDEEFTACSSDESMMECIYEAFGSIMIKHEPNTKESYFARNADGSLVMSLSSPGARGSHGTKKIRERKNKPSEKEKKKKKKKKYKPKEDVDFAALNNNKRSVVASGAGFYHGYTEHLSKFTLLATSWDAGHPYTNPAAYGNYSAVFGRNNKTSNSSIIAGEDNFTTAYSAVFGRNNTGLSSYSLVAGQDNYVDSSYALVSGKNNEVENAANSLVVGYFNDVNGEYTSAIGHANHIEGQGSHIVGSGITINGDNSYAFGYGDALNPTLIQGDEKIAFVYGTETLLLVDGINGTIQVGGSNGGGLVGTFNGTFIGDGSGLYNLNPNAFNGVLLPAKGGTGIANLGTYSWGNSNVSILNNHDFTMRLQGVTDVTFPVSGILSTRNGTEALTNKTINDSTLGPNLTFAAGTSAVGDFSFLNSVSFNGSVLFNNSMNVAGCATGDFLLSTANGVLQCTDFATAASAVSFSPVGSNGSIQYKLNGAIAGSNELQIINGGNGITAAEVETNQLTFFGSSPQVAGNASFAGNIDFNNNLVLDNSFSIPSCTTAGYLLVNDGNGSFSCVDPSTVVTAGSGNGGSATAHGVDFAIQFNNNGSFSSDPDFRFENGHLMVRNIDGLESLTLNAATISGNADFAGTVVISNQLRIADGNQGNGKILVGDANGRVSWVDPSTVFNGSTTSNGAMSNGSSLAVAGNNGAIQFNQGGVLGADTDRLQYTEDTLKAQSITAVSMQVRNASANISINWSEGNQQQINLSQDTTTIAVATDPAGPTTVMMQLMHNSNVATKTINWPANFMFSDGSPPIMSTAANAVDFVSCFYNPLNGPSGTYYCQASYNFF